MLTRNIFRHIPATDPSRSVGKPGNGKSNVSNKAGLKIGFSFNGAICRGLSSNGVFFVLHDGNDLNIFPTPTVSNG